MHKKVCSLKLNLLHIFSIPSCQPSIASFPRKQCISFSCLYTGTRSSEFLLVFENQNVTKNYLTLIFTWRNLYQYQNVRDENSQKSTKSNPFVDSPLFLFIVTVSSGKG
jgi:hypothetical protein